MSEQIAEQLINKLEEYKKASLKDECLAFIKDKSVDLKFRWFVYRNMPENFLKCEGYIVHFDIEQYLQQREIDWYDDFYIERQETVHMKRIIETLEDRLTKPDLYKKSQIWSSELIDDFKEEILQKELGSFIMDW